MKNLSIYLFLFIILTVFKSQGQENSITLKKSDLAPVIDGVLTADEWTDAIEVNIIGPANPQVKVLVKYDAENLFVAFLNLTDATNIRRNAEVLIHTAPENATWDQNAYWFHASYSNCAAEGAYYNWEDCTMNPPDWQASTFPFKNDNNNIEFRISFKKLQITPSAKTTLSIAFKLSDPLEEHHYWPAEAEISNPATWGTLQF
jgi:hypothetical protein